MHVTGMSKLLERVRNDPTPPWQDNLRHHPTMQRALITHCTHHLHAHQQLLHASALISHSDDNHWIFCHGEQIRCLFAIFHSARMPETHSIVLGKKTTLLSTGFLVVVLMGRLMLGCLIHRLFLFFPHLVQPKLRAHTLHIDIDILEPAHPLLDSFEIDHYCILVWVGNYSLVLPLYCKLYWVRKYSWWWWWWWCGSSCTL